LLGKAATDPSLVLGAKRLATLDAAGEGGAQPLPPPPHPPGARVLYLVDFLVAEVEGVKMLVCAANLLVFLRVFDRPGHSLNYLGRIRQNLEGFACRAQRVSAGRVR